MKNKGLALLLTTVMVLSLATTESFANGSAEASASKTQSALSFDIVDSVGRTVHFEKPAVTCFTGYQGGSFLTLCALFGDKAADHLACWDGYFETWGPDFYREFCEAVPGLASVPLVGQITPNTLNVEAVIASHPDVAIIPIYYFQLEGIHNNVVSQLEAAGIPVVCTNYRRDELENHLHCMDILGKIFGAEERAQELADFYKEQVSIVYSRVNKLIEQKTDLPVFYVEYASNGAAKYGMSYSNLSQWGNIITSVGATTLYAESDTLYPQADPEFVLKSDPDIILILAEQKGNPEESMTKPMSMGVEITEEMAAAEVADYLARPGWDSLTAVKEGRVYAICNSLTHDIPSFYCFQHIAKIVWPDDFNDIDPDANLKEFFDRFMPIKFSGTWFYKMK